MADHAEIAAVLPHRHPILLVDLVLDLVPFESAVGIKAISGSEACYGGLPELAPPAALEYPASLMLESFVQTGAFLWLSSLEQADARPPGTLVLTVLRDVVVHGAARPGELLRNTVRILRRMPEAAMLTGQIHAGDRLLAEVGSALAAIRPVD
ncbi:MAG TPA: hypothetical protein VH298_06275 [Jatrophihabitans sp.]|nr:hypothetical protein [Jatrophihabitans sp.]